MKRASLGFLVVLLALVAYGLETLPQKAPFGDFDPTTTLWYAQPADKWENAFPAGNGRLGAMVFGNTDEERIQFNEETYWSGGPYAQTKKGGHKALPEIQRLIFAGEYQKAHKLFGRNLMGYPVEQMKYQAFGDLMLKFSADGKVTGYSHRLDLEEALVTTTYHQNGTWFKREVLVSPMDQVIVVRLTADRPGQISCLVNLRGRRNQAHSNYATDYFRMDGYGQDGLTVQGKSADYLGVEGRLRYYGRLKAVPEGGRMQVDDTDLIIQAADTLTLFLAAATNFVNYKDVSGDARARVEAVFKALGNKDYSLIKKEHVQAHQQLFNRVSLNLGTTPESYAPTDERRKNYDGSNDPDLAALCFQYGRYMLISSSRPGTQPANLQGIWNKDMNPSWDSKYTTNINTEMNYWPAEVGNLSECGLPLFQMIHDLSDQGSDVAKEHYGARGWVFHQNTDIWRVAAPMDGPDWGAFNAGGAWLCTHLWEHYLYTGDKEFLKDFYPILKGSVEFFMDFLVEHPTYGWLVTNPSTSPENFPDWPGNDNFYDEVCGWISPGTTICTGSTIDMQLLRDLFTYVVEAAGILEVDRDFRQEVLAVRDRLAPMQIGKKGELQEWLEDWGQKEKSHRHISHLYGLFPGNQISLRRTPELAEGCRVVLDQRGLEGNGWSSAWKMGCWARLQNPEKALDNFHYYIKNYTFDSLYAICSRALQVDGLFGVSAAVAEMLVQSHEDELFLLPALPVSWGSGEMKGLRARGGFELDMIWEKSRISSVLVQSFLGKTCRIRVKHPVDVTSKGRSVPVVTTPDGLISFETESGNTYSVKSRGLK